MILECRLLLLMWLKVFLLMVFFRWMMLLWVLVVFWLFL